MGDEAPRQTFEGQDPRYLAELPGYAIRARDVLGLICLHGGGEPPHMTVDLAPLYERIVAHPDTCLTLTSAFDCGGGPFQFPREDSAYQRRMDLHVLQRLMLSPGDARSARELFRRAGKEITSLDGICVFETPTERWPNWPEEAVAAYLRGLQTPLPEPRTPEQLAQMKQDSVAEIEGSEGLFIRPHHLMCITCFYGGGATGPIPGDNLWEPLARIKANPDLPVTLVEGDCMVCPPCGGHDHRSGTCIRLCGLKDRRKDLDTLRLLDLLPGDTMPARELLARYVERIPHVRVVCDYGEQRVPEWLACGGSFSGNYEKGLAKIKAELGI
ncbi:hypothetical protein LLH23_14630 [bacterium]|nr:hypothetical protein [bacterium]